MTNDNEIAEIVAGLSDEQRAMVLDLPHGGEWVYMRPIERYASFGKDALCGFGKSGLVEGDYQSMNLRYHLTPLGRAVRDALQREKNDAD